MCLRQTLVEKVLAERESGRMGGGYTISWQLDVVPLVDAHNALLAEVEYLRGERAAVVAWLRNDWEQGVGMFAEAARRSIDCIERGEHRREEGA